VLHCNIHVNIQVTSVTLINAMPALGHASLTIILTIYYHTHTPHEERRIYNKKTLQLIHDITRKQQFHVQSTMHKCSFSRESISQNVLLSRNMFNTEIT